MIREELEKTLSQVAPFAERVCFHVMGEPLQHPEFTDYVEQAGSLGVHLEITTNGTLLSPDKQKALLHPAVVQVNFSLQSFIDNFPKANADTYLKGVLGFCRQAQLARPDLYVNLRLWNLNQGADNDPNEYFFKKIEDEFGVSLNRRVDPSFKKSKRIVDRIYLHFDSRFEWPNIRGPRLSERGTCHGTRSHVAIHADGKVVPCCLDKEARIVLGDLKKESFAAIIQNSRTTAMTQGFEQGQLIEDLCQRCTYIQRFEH